MVSYSASPTETPWALVAILCAAKKTGDRELERTARSQLREKCGIELKFAGPRWQVPKLRIAADQEPAHA